MNIAFSAVIIFILLLSPVAFYLAYNFGRFPKARPQIGLLESLMLLAIFSVILHGTAISVMQSEIRFDILALLIGGDLKTFGALVSNTEFKTYFQTFISYNAILISIAILAARGLRFLVRYFGWHTRSDLLRLYNQWWYFFLGYKRDSFVKLNTWDRYDIVHIDAMVNTQTGTMIYSGYLIDFVCKGEELDRIYLAETTRQELKRNTDPKNNKVEIDTSNSIDIKGEVFSIPYHSIININIQFLSMS